MASDTNETNETNRPPQKAIRRITVSEPTTYLDEHGSALAALYGPASTLPEEPVTIIIHEDDEDISEVVTNMGYLPEISEDVEVIVTVEGKHNKPILEIVVPQLVPQLLELKLSDAISGDLPGVTLFPVSEINDENEMIVVETVDSEMNLMISVPKEIIQGFTSKGIDLRRDLSKAIREANVMVKQRKKIRGDEWGDE